MEWYSKVLKNYANFYGRARRKELWIYNLFNAIIFIVLFILQALITNPAVAIIIGLLTGIYALGVLVPSLAVTARRLHDIGMSGWLLLIYLVPFLGGLAIFVLACLDSQAGDNEHGPNPKYGDSSKSDTVSI
ncbi:MULTISPECIES: DUF805 domain-containing protein [Bacillus]|uniref:DUF805 domain-containing protein n=2 Tax=Bacillus TaxID=1386 RepID=A0A0M4FW38_9BACI|nr:MULTISPECIES: DUF805 domain-containing protein [Bacillus]ALC82918.1 hypothetical protein AM592_15975 [Bacillus gobiensis]MBP1081898.1 uncharacterized membrane protein YhaH (DUF805 family) [Bacillus capparidis]MED1096545.1 DUF805 domain-containing protein [Bacillus capparidis]